METEDKLLTVLQNLVNYLSTEIATVKALMNFTTEDMLQDAYLNGKLEILTEVLDHLKNIDEC